MAEPSTARVVILAGGSGTRMVSRLPKPLHRVGGLPMVEHLLRVAASVSPRPPLVVVNPDQGKLADYLSARAEMVQQPEPLGTGDALLAARSALQGEEAVMVLPADLPLVRAESLLLLRREFHAHSARAALLGAEVSDARGYGRLLRGANQELAGIVEDADSPWDGRSTEVNVGVYLFAGRELWPAVDQLRPDNSQGELYLSAVPQLLGALVVGLSDPKEAIQVNDRLQLASAEAAMRSRTIEAVMRSGVTVEDPSATWLDCDVRVGEDSVLLAGTVIRGRSVIGRECELGPFAELRDVTMGDGCRVARAHLVDCHLADGVDIGPFNRVRPGSWLERSSHLGTFTEVVRSRIGPGSQVPHLSYVGDSQLGSDVNIGAGSITANWDGQEKHRTVIGDGARIGSDTILVAPVEVGDGAYTAAGSVITGDVPAGSLGVARARQRNVEGYTARARRGRRAE